MATFYFTFGSDERYPYQNGWVEVEAPTLKDAQGLYGLVYPGRNPDVPVGNYADVYTEEEFWKTEMAYQGNRGGRCHERLSLIREPREGVGKNLIWGPQKNCIRLMKILLDMARTNPSNIIKSDLRMSGSVLLNSGVEKLVNELGLMSAEYENAADEKGALRFTIAAFNDIEVLQVDPLEDDE